MDTLTHALSGALLARVIAARPAANTTGWPPGLPRRGRLSAPWDGQPGAPALWQTVLVGFVAAMFPDIDAVVQPFGDLAYLRHHRGVTHSLLLLPLWAALLAWIVSKWFAATRRQPGGWRSFWLVCAGGIGLHIVGDWITVFGTMLLAPLSDLRFGLGAVFIIDLVLSGLVILGLLLAALWPRRRWPAVAGLLAVAAWVGVCWVGQQEALAFAAAQAPVQAPAHATARPADRPQVLAIPRPASPFNWTVAVADGDRWQLAHINTRRQQPLVVSEGDHFVRRFSAPYLPLDQARWQTLPRVAAPDSPPWVQQAWQRPELAVVRWFTEVPSLLLADDGTARGGERCAFWRDLRFELPGREESPFRYGLCLGAGDSAGVWKLVDGRRLPL